MAKQVRSAGADRRLSRDQELVLQGLQRALDEPLDLVDLFRVVYEAAQQVLDATGFYLATYDETSQTIEVVRQIDSGVELPGGAFPLGEGFTSTVIRNRQPALVRQWSRERTPFKVQYATGRPGLPESAITVPLLGVLPGPAVGVLSVQSYAAEAYDEGDLAFMQALAEHTARFVEGRRRARRTELQMARKNQELEGILAGLQDALIVTDASGAIVRFNAAARELLEAAPSIVVGQPLDQPQWGVWPLGTRALAEAFGPLIADLRRGIGRQDMEVQLWREEGLRIVSINSSPLRDGDGGIGGGILLIRDVTARRALERLKDNVLSVASHDLKTPVSVMRGRAELLLRDVERGRAGSERLVSGLDRIIGSSARLLEMLDLLLDLSKIEGGGLDLHPVVGDVVTVVREVADGMSAISKHHRVCLDTPETLVGVWDLARLRQVVQNLVSNAIKYSPDGGTVSIRLEAGPGSMQLAVTDEGVGLTSEELPRVFDRFYRVEGTRRLEGSGLGLYICQAIVSAHAGHISARSAGPGRGTTFEVVLPQVAHAAAACRNAE